MKKLSFLALLLTLSCSAVFAQWSVSGTVTDVNSMPVAGKTVYVHTDTFVLNSPQYDGYDVTDANGNYTVSFATGTPDFQQVVNIGLYDCNNSWVNDTVMYNNNPAITHDFTICVPAPVATDIHGVISANSVAQNDAEVYLVRMDIDSIALDTTLTAIDSVPTDAQGYYSFNIPGNAGDGLMVKAALLPANANYAGYLPTYYTSAIKWFAATLLPNPLPLTNVDIDLIAGVNPGGPAFIGGDVSLGANKSTAVGDPLNHRILILTNAANVPVAYTYSDAAGHFSFPNLALGTYKLFGDVMGKTNPAMTIVLDAAHQSVTNIEFQEHSHLFEGHLLLSVGNVPAALQNAVAFPTPAIDKVTVTGINNIAGARSVTLAAMNGTVVYTHTFGEKDAMTIPVASLSKGIYMLHVNTTEGNVIFKVTK